MYTRLVGTKNGHYTNPGKGTITNKETIAEIASFIDESPESFYRLVIGSDSQVKVVGKSAQCDYVTAIIIHRVGMGARYFWKRERTTPPPSLRSKIYEETMRSLAVAQSLVPEIQKEIESTNYEFEIHIDVGTVGSTREMIKEVVGMVTGSGFTAKTKPESWGASKVADKYT